jgi:hypothetical protein
MPSSSVSPQDLHQRAGLSRSFRQSSTRQLGPGYLLEQTPIGLEIKLIAVRRDHQCRLHCRLGNTVERRSEQQVPLPTTNGSTKPKAPLTKGSLAFFCGCRGLSSLRDVGAS